MDKVIAEPTEPGIYAYSGGNGEMAFGLDRSGQWWVYSELVKQCLPCAWEYIEQALGKYNDLVQLEKI